MTTLKVINLGGRFGLDEEARTANKRLAKKRVQYINEALCFVSSSVLADSSGLRFQPSSPSPKPLATTVNNDRSTMKFIKRTFLTILILTTVVILFRGWVYRHLVTYKSVGLRTTFSATDEELTDYIDASIGNQTNPDIEQIVKLGLLITSKKLNFTTDKNDTDPNKLITSKTAHCVGYASFFATTFNYLFKKYNLDDRWSAKPQIGQLYFLGTNVHKYFNSSFFKDHDFVTIENKETGELFAVDPTVHDYLYINFITYVK